MTFPPRFAAEATQRSSHGHATAAPEALDLRGGPEERELPTPAPDHPASEVHPAHPSRRPWALRRTKDGTTLIATFRGRLGGRDGQLSAECFAAEIARRPAHVIWNLTEMIGYEAAARVAWQRALWPVRHLIRGIDVVGGSPLVRVGAVTLTMVLGVEANFREAARFAHPTGALETHRASEERGDTEAA